MQSIKKLLNDSSRVKKPLEFKNRRDELVHLITEGINQTRVGTKWGKITKRTVALRINSNPYLSKDDGEVDLLYKECEKKGNYSKFFWVTKKLSTPSA